MYILIITYLLNGQVDKVDKDIVLETKEECVQWKKGMDTANELRKRMSPNSNIEIRSECVKQ